MKAFTDKSCAVIHDSVYKADSTKIYAPGVLAVLDGDTAVPADADETGAVLGVCLGGIEYSAAGDAFVRIADSPTTVYACPAPEITLTAGGTAAVTAGGIAAFTDNCFNGGVLKLSALGAGSTNSGRVGDEYEIADFDAGDKEFTLGTTLTGAASAGDRYLVFPPVGASLGVLDSGIKKILLTAATSNFALRVVGWDTGAGNILVMANRHIYGTKAN